MRVTYLLKDHKRKVYFKRGSCALHQALYVSSVMCWKGARSQRFLRNKIVFLCHVNMWQRSEVVFLTSSKHPVEYRSGNVTLKYIIRRLFLVFIKERQTIAILADQKSNQPFWLRDVYV
jgi:hypothetical protein